VMLMGVVCTVVARLVAVTTMVESSVVDSAGVESAAIVWASAPVAVHAKAENPNSATMRVRYPVVSERIFMLIPLD
jgi:hypothetical protein